MKRSYSISLPVLLMAGLAAFPLACIEGLPGSGGSVDPYTDLSGDDAGDGGGTASGYCEPIGTPDTDTQQQMLNALNNYRVANGLHFLMYSDTLEQAAQDYAERMAQEGFFSHTSPDGGQALDRATTAGFCSPSLIGENLAMGQTSVTQVQSGWQGSPGHNENMVREVFTFVGMGHATSVWGTQYWVQLFGTTSW